MHVSIRCQINFKVSDGYSNFLADRRKWVKKLPGGIFFVINYTIPPDVTVLLANDALISTIFGLSMMVLVKTTY